MQTSHGSGGTIRPVSDTDFLAAWMAVKDFRSELAGGEVAKAPAIMASLEDLISRRVHEDQPHARIFFLEASHALTELMLRGGRLGRRARDVLSRTALYSPGKPRLTAAEALGSLPLPGSPMAAPPLPDTTPAATSFPELLGRAGLPTDTASIRLGRTLVFGCPGRDVLAVKFAQTRQDASNLAVEAAWMRALAHEDFGVRFDIPEPLESDGRLLVRLPPGGPAPRHHAALAYLAHGDYFAYPNEPVKGELPDPESFNECLSRAAYLFGSLAARGVVHEAPIPLFHNRVQSERRSDGGIYEWWRMGRLDRWLESCRHPNFGLSGIRDFEHLKVVPSGGRTFFRALGSEVLSLLLVAGSYFRAREPERVGFRVGGEPVDARDLFDAELLARVVRDLRDSFHFGLAGRGPENELDAGPVAERMIREMGVDENMVELLRVQDQAEMSDGAFVDFLMDRGVGEDEARKRRRGEEDVALATGPHLGNFNGRMSLPEISEYAASVVAEAIGGGFWVE